jgi:hypothetical protein
MGMGVGVQLPKEAAIIVELLKKIFKTTSCMSLGIFVQAAMHCRLPSFLLDHVIAVSPDKLAAVANSAALRIHAVDTIKAILAADELNATNLQAMLNAHSAWSEYKSQSHDLYLTVRVFQTFCIIAL